MYHIVEMSLKSSVDNPVQLPLLRYKFWLYISYVEHNLTRFAGSRKGARQYLTPYFSAEILPCLQISAKIYSQKRHNYKYVCNLD